uniref:Uncharacterized protein n=1 Tax=Arundo donax TaxID=35708 RepID=A0A0A9AVJ3_ARUDO
MGFLAFFPCDAVGIWSVATSFPPFSRQFRGFDP